MLRSDFTDAHADLDLGLAVYLWHKGLFCMLHIMSYGCFPFGDAQHNSSKMLFFFLTKKAILMKTRTYIFMKK